MICVPNRHVDHINISYGGDYEGIIQLLGKNNYLLNVQKL